MLRFSAAIEGRAIQSRSRLIERKRRNAETVQSLGMRSRFARMFLELNGRLATRQSAVNDTTILVSTISRTMRMFIQSVLLTVGALLVINGQVVSNYEVDQRIKFLQVLRAPGDPEKTAWDTHAANFGPLKNLHCPKLDRSLSALDAPQAIVAEDPQARTVLADGGG